MIMGNADTFPVLRAHSLAGVGVVDKMKQAVAVIEISLSYRRSTEGTFSLITLCGQLIPCVSALVENSDMHCSSREPVAHWESGCTSETSN